MPAAVVYIMILRRHPFTGKSIRVFRLCIAWVANDPLAVAERPEQKKIFLKQFGLYDKLLYI
jgi:hypothetical protein